MIYKLIEGSKNDKNNIIAVYKIRTPANLVGNAKF